MRIEFFIEYDRVLVSICNAKIKPKFQTDTVRQIWRARMCNNLL